ncbi:MAG: formylglycine-generating enzyme family protein [Puniceicoccaceae bacterium]|nr:MAG: formylglycine-generating enzyme family protein [Puniceicoccaceae bacterium]
MTALLSNYFKVFIAIALCLQSLQGEIASCCDTAPSRFSEEPPAALDGMVWIPAGEFTMGGTVRDFMLDWPSFARSRNDERPLHSVTLSGFWISETPITNRQFKAFVDATGYITTAEKAPKLEDILPLLPPGTPPPPQEALIPASLLFKAPEQPVSLNNPLAWWQWKSGANWKQPEGPGSSIEDRWDHPVVHVSYFDASAYADWRGMSLPTEAQWEYAARGGKDQQAFTWGDAPISENEPSINVWQGVFPNENTLADGYLSTSPVKAFSPNGYGLYDMAGNVWEWVADWYHVDAYAQRSNGDKAIVDPQGPTLSYDPQEPHLAKRVIRGGSFLCNDAYCSGYRPAARMKNSPDTSSNHMGFRVVKNLTE